MINLLPPERQKLLRAGRANLLLLRYNILLFCAAGFLALACGGVYVYLSVAKNSAVATIETNASKVTDYTSTETEAAAFRRNLSTAKQILDKEIVYTDIVVRIAQTLPSGVVLENLNLDAKTFGTPTILSARAVSSEKAIALKDALQNSPLFSDVHFQSVSRADGTDNTAEEYPFLVTLNVTIKKDTV